MKHLPTGKNKEQFEKWYFKTKCKSTLKYKDLSIFQHEDVFGWFYNLDFEFQIGVLLSYYESKGYRITVSDNICSFRASMSYEEAKKICKWGFEINHHNYASFKYKTSYKAYKEAFIKANELINKKL